MPPIEALQLRILTRRVALLLIEIMRALLLRTYEMLISTLSTLGEKLLPNILCP